MTGGNMPPKETDTDAVPVKKAEAVDIATESRKLADTEGITVAAAAEKLTKKAAAGNGQ